MAAQTYLSKFQATTIKAVLFTLKLARLSYLCKNSIIINPLLGHVKAEPIRKSGTREGNEIYGISNSVLWPGRALYEIKQKPSKPYAPQMSSSNYFDFESFK